MSTETTTKRTHARTPNPKTTIGFRLSDELWAVLEPLLPVHVTTHRFGGDRPWASERRCADAIFYGVRTGGEWVALNETALCATSIAHDRCSHGVAVGVLLQLWQAGRERLDELKEIAWAWLGMDGAMTKAPLGEEKTGPNPTDRGTDGVKRSLVTEGHGVPIGVTIDGAKRHEMKLVRATIVCIGVEQPNPTEAQPQGMGVANGYADDAVRTIRAEFGFMGHMRSLGEAAKALAREVGQRARRWVVKRSHSWRNRFRRLLVRWEKKAAHHLAVLHVACGVIAFRAAGLRG